MPGRSLVHDNLKQTTFSQLAIQSLFYVDKNVFSVRLPSENLRRILLKPMSRRLILGMAQILEVQEEKD